MFCNPETNLVISIYGCTVIGDAPGTHANNQNQLQLETIANQRQQQNLSTMSGCADSCNTVEEFGEAVHTS